MSWVDDLLARAVVEGGGPCPKCQPSGGPQRTLITVPPDEPDLDLCPVCERPPNVKIRIPDNGRVTRKP